MITATAGIVVPVGDGLHLPPARAARPARRGPRECPGMPRAAARRFLLRRAPPCRGFFATVRKALACGRS